MRTSHFSSKRKLLEEGSSFSKRSVSFENGIFISKKVFLQKKINISKGKYYLPVGGVPGEVSFDGKQAETNFLFKGMASLKD